MTDAVTLSQSTQVVSAGTGSPFQLPAVRSFAVPLAPRSVASSQHRFIN